jgi:hypothetical protein
MEIFAPPRARGSSHASTTALYTCDVDGGYARQLDGGGKEVWSQWLEGVGRPLPSALPLAIGCVQLSMHAGSQPCLIYGSSSGVLPRVPAGNCLSRVDLVPVI